MASRTLFKNEDLIGSDTANDKSHDSILNGGKSQPPEEEPLPGGRMSTRQKIQAEAIHNAPKPVDRQLNEYRHQGHLSEFQERQIRQRMGGKGLPNTIVSGKEKPPTEIRPARLAKNLITDDTFIEGVRETLHGLTPVQEAIVQKKLAQQQISKTS